MKKLLLLNDTYDQENWGAQAGTYALKKIFMSDPTRQLEVKTLNYSWMEERYVMMPKWLGGRVVPSSKLGKLSARFSLPFKNLPLVADEYEYMSDIWLKSENDPIAKVFVEMCKEVDAIVLNGEGSVYRNNYTARKGLFLLWFAHRKLNKPAFFLNGSVHLTRVDPILPAMVRKTFCQISGVAVREPWSRKNLKEFYPNISVDVIPDSVFYLFKEINKTPKMSTIETQFCAFSPPMLVTAIDGMYRSSKEYSWLYKLIVQMKKIVPQVVLLAKEPRDMALQKLAEDTNCIFFGPNNSVEDLVTILRQAKFLVSGRYHHLILATILGVPCIPLATTSHKVHGLCDLFAGHLGYPHDCTDLENESASILDKSSLLISEGEEHGDKLQKYAEEFSKNVLSLRTMVGLS